MLTLLGVAGGVLLVAALILVNQAPAATDFNRPPPNPALSLADGRDLGRADAAATLTVWSDFQCPACGTFTRASEERLIREYVVPGTLRLRYRDIAFLGDESIAAAVGARCAADQGRFWPYHDYLFRNQRGENQGAFSEERLRALAATVGLDVGAYDRCVDGGATRDAVRAETAEAGRLGFTSTPTLVTGDQVIRGVPDWTELVTTIHAQARLPAPPTATAAP